MSHASEEGENYWPGYVDALTSMVQVLAFVMMMLAMAVFVLSQSVSKHAVEAIAKAVNANVKPNADVKQLTQAVMEKIQEIHAAAPESVARTTSQPPGEAPAAKPASSSAAVTDAKSNKVVGVRLSGAQTYNDPSQQPSPDAVHLTLNFEDRSFRIDQERTQSLFKFIDDNKVVEQAQTAVISAYAYSGDGALSDARRLAYYRAMMARKELIDTKVRPDNIRIIVNDTADQQKGGTVDITIAGTHVQHGSN